jgi:hypothetical protein
MRRCSSDLAGAGCFGAGAGMDLDLVGCGGAGAGAEGGVDGGGSGRLAGPLVAGLVVVGCCGCWLVEVGGLY